MSFVRIKLLPRSMLGRRFQYAFASLAMDWADIDYGADEIVFPDEITYVSVVEQALKNIVGVYTTTKPLKNCKVDTVVDGIRCCHLQIGPRLYRNDYNDIKKTGLTKCPYITAKGEIKYAWTHLAISYALEVIERKGPLRGPSEYGVPLLAKSTLFSKTRGIVSRKKVKDIKVDKDTLGTMLLGASLSFLGLYNVSRSGQEPIEFYLLPDIPSKTYSTLLQVASLQGLTNNLAALTANFVKSLGVGIETAVTLAIAILLHRSEALVSGLEGEVESLVSGVKLYTVSPSRNRPQLRSGIPLSLSIYKTYTKRSIQLISMLLQSRNASVRDAVRECINDMFLQSTNPCSGSFLVDCGRMLSALTHEKDLRRDVIELAVSLLNSLDKEYTRMISECGVV